MKKPVIIFIMFLLCNFTAFGQTTDINSFLDIAAKLENEGKNNEAVLELTNAIAIAPNNTNLYLRRAEIKYKLKDYQGTFEDSLKGVELTPFNKKLNTTLLFSVLSVELKNDQKVFEYYKLVLNSLDKRFKNAAEFPKQLPGFPDSGLPKIPYNPRQMELFSDILFALTRCAGLYEEKGLTAKADELLKRIGQYDPQWHTIAVRANYYLARKRYPEGIADLTTAIELRQKDPASLGKLYLQRGDTYVLINQYEKAVADYEAAQTTDKFSAMLAKNKISRIRPKISKDSVQPK